MPGGKTRNLLVEDEPELRESSRMLLTAATNTILSSEAFVPTKPDLRILQPHEDEEIEAMSFQGF